MSVANVPAVERGFRSARAAAPAGKGLDRTKLLNDLTRLNERHRGDADAFRDAAIRSLQAALDRGPRRGARGARGGRDRDEPAPRR